MSDEAALGDEDSLKILSGPGGIRTLGPQLAALSNRRLVP